MESRKIPARLRQRVGSSDYVLLGLFGILLIFGLIMLTSASSVIGYNRFGDTYFFIKRQVFYGVLPGIVACIFFAKLPYQMLKKLAVLIAVGSVLLLIAVLIPGVGSSFNKGAKSWLVFGGVSFQPAEFAKLGLVFGLALLLERTGKRITELKEGFLPAIGAGLFFILCVVLQPDIGTASILFAIVLALLFVAGARPSHISILLLLAAVAFGALIAVAPYRAARFTTFLHPELDPQGVGYHINQAYYAIGSGGWLGRGLGYSRQKFQYLPEVHADSIFAIIAEEMGFVLIVVFLVFLVCIAYRGLHIATNAPDDFGRLVVAGIICWFIIQSFFNIAAMVGLMPITGVPLPFVSHGGTALVISLAAVGCVLNVSRQT
ncbi:MAG: putative lipid II flippase FtsW [Candidatus Magasanikbacteria bacterium]|jgi:cell division protein FtsW|nr:putative lipid II flippase FtsW [Candidatus Magasanikbacteria bacterium]MBT5262392.1 putative lipid II flippase FtsW [Candidatus Magasanikbacteria bacterium]MBT5820575.1 putative lipid II flippase FtsW [Candidatus Magasanikbacteria bacterium]MBT6294511.1 putative lipid II flippase FtsW [Candidatus Magasanikbacteria bacterium]